MFVEKRKSGKNTKYYLSHSYRDENGKVKKIRKYLGSNLSKSELKVRKLETEKEIFNMIEEMNVRVFFFTLTKKKLESLNKLSEKIEIVHLNKDEWKKFEKDFVYNTNAIEGSTVSLEEVKEIVENEKKPVGYDEIETKNVAAAVEYIRKTDEKLSLDFLLKLHKICFDKTKDFAGKFRNVNVIIKDSSGKIIHSGVPKDQLSNYLKNFILWYEENREKFKPLVLASILHNQFEFIHPFQDGNGRVGRLLSNFILLKNNYPPINILLEGRAEYYKILNEYSKNDNLKPTLDFFIKQYKKTLKKVTTKKKK